MAGGELSFERFMFGMLIRHPCRGVMSQKGIYSANDLKLKTVNAIYILSLKSRLS